MRVCAVVLAAVFLALTAVTCWAYPTLQGATGVVILPTAQVAPLYTVNAAVAYEKIDDPDGKYWPIRAAIGVADNAELSLNYGIIDTDFGNLDGWGIGGKYQLMSEATGSVLDLAVGGSFNRTDIDSLIDDELDAVNVYLAASKKLSSDDEQTPFSVIGHAGLMYGKFDAELADESYIKPFVGVSLVGKQGTSLSLEYRFEDDDVDLDAPFSAVLRHSFNNVPFWVEVGITNHDPVFRGAGLDDNELFFGVGYVFGAR